jgi:hypothetical protein
VRTALNDCLHFVSDIELRHCCTIPETVTESNAGSSKGWLRSDSSAQSLGSEQS